MVRKTVFTRQDIVQAGVQVVENEELSGLSARRVADEMGASTAPVYSNFANMDELAIAVKRMVAEELLEFTQRDYTADRFLNIGIGVLEFARQKPSLYRAIFLQDSSKCEAGPRVMAQLASRMEGMAGLGELPQSERLMLLHQMSIFTHGLAARICSGMVKHFTFEDLILILEDAGAGMIHYAMSQPERSANHQALIQSLMDENPKEVAGDE